MACSNEKFIIHTEEFEIIKDFSDEDMGKLFRALLKFVQTGEETELSFPLKIAFGFISSHVKRDIDKYNDVSEKRRAAGRRNGAKERESEDGISETDENKTAKQADFKDIKANKKASAERDLNKKTSIESNSEESPSKESKSDEKSLIENNLENKASEESFSNGKASEESFSNGKAPEESVSNGKASKKSVSNDKVSKESVSNENTLIESNPNGKSSAENTLNDKALTESNSAEKVSEEAKPKREVISVLKGGSKIVIGDDGEPVVALSEAMRRAEKISHSPRSQYPKSDFTNINSMFSSIASETERFKGYTPTPNGETRGYTSQGSESRGYTSAHGVDPTCESKNNNVSSATPKVIKSIEEGFEDFWMHYPKKVNKSQAREEYFALAPSPELHSEMIESLERQKRSITWEKEDGRFIPHGSKWLKLRRWEDELETTNGFHDQSFDTMKFLEAAVKKSMRD